MKKLSNLFFSVCITTCAYFPTNKQIKTVGRSFEYGTAKAVCVMEQDSRRILCEYNGDLRLPMASTTKIATAITVLELEKNLSKEIVIPNEAVGVEGSSVYLKEGEKCSVQDLLYGLMLRSGNDCAVALSLHCCGNVDRFCSKMNEISQKAGALNTVFKNPHGLPCKGHYTTARDLSLISCYAMENSVFREIVATKFYQPKNWKNKNKMLTNYDGIGIKTGYTKEAGRCLVSAKKEDDMTLICSVLSCYDTYEVSTRLLDDAFSIYKRVKLLDKTQEYTVQDAKKTIKGKVKEDFYYPLSEGEENHLEIRTKAVFSNEIVGQIEIYLAKRLLFSGNLYKL